jgi:lipopolysaccharide/colanic/teichoic acid biosynthesis glycosyltransferase
MNRTQCLYESMFIIDSILPLRTFLRKIKINELLRLLKIFFGDVSVIGIRPLTVKSFGLIQRVPKLLYHKLAQAFQVWAR